MTLPKIDLRQGDCLAELRSLPSGSVDLIVADPPYNLGKDYGNNHDVRGFRDYLEFTETWLTESRRVLKTTGSIYVFMGVRFISYLYDILDQKLGFFFNRLDYVALHARHGRRPGGFLPGMRIFFFSQNPKTLSSDWIRCGFLKNTSGPETT